MTPEKETPTQSRSDTFGHSTTLKETPTPKTVEEVVANFITQCESKTIGGISPLMKGIIRTLLPKYITAQNQAADERLREVVRDMYGTIDYSPDVTRERMKAVIAKHCITNL